MSSRIFPLFESSQFHRREPIRSSQQRGSKRACCSFRINDSALNDSKRFSPLERFEQTRMKSCQTMNCIR